MIRGKSEKIFVGSPSGPAVFFFFRSLMDERRSEEVMGWMWERLGEVGTKDLIKKD